MLDLAVLVMGIVNLVIFAADPHGITLLNLAAGIFALAVFLKNKVG